MRAGDAAGGTDGADDFAGGEVGAEFGFDGVEVAVHGDQAVAVVDVDRVAVEKELADFDDGAGGGRVDGRAFGSGDVHAGVGVARLAVEHATRAVGVGAHAFDRGHQL